MAEIELNVLSGQCLKRWINNISEVKKEVLAWQKARKTKNAKVNWQFTTKDARIKINTKHRKPTFWNRRWLNRRCANWTNRSTREYTFAGWRAIRSWSAVWSNSSEAWPSWSTRTTFILIQTNKDGLITAWVALDDATMGNGRLFFAEGTHLGPVYSTQPQRTNHSIYRCHSTSLNVAGTGG
ncbi:hypothetical protein CMK12_10085 [Candidatus Poribacteria bacterium]|nr:hypothetical protein [Candidatus Poribacteria bacterium]